MPKQFHVPWSPKCATAASLTEGGEGSALCGAWSLGPRSCASAGGRLCEIVFIVCFAASPAPLAAQTRISPSPLGQPPQSSPSSSDGALSFLSCKSSYVNRCLFFQFISAFVETLLVSNSRHNLSQK